MSGIYYPARPTRIVRCVSHPYNRSAASQAKRFCRRLIGSAQTQSILESDLRLAASEF
jgi:hypothetical protein